LLLTETKTYKLIPSLDERSAAYMALGNGATVAKTCCFNMYQWHCCIELFPAIAEAFYQKIPLVVLTADRPFDLLNQQDGQMINQVNVFDSHVRGSLNFDSILRISNSELYTFLNKSMFPVMDLFISMYL
jgi:2-succinyl-5-enolpyruvyl-6-hydroxy-3-cyclohexene-1-carboxylate synthase